MLSEFLQLLHEDGRREIYKGTKRHIFVAVFLNTTRHTVNVYCCRLLLTDRHSACHVQLHNSTAHLLYKYCTNCTVCNWTVLTVITQQLLLHVQLHNSTTHLLYQYCTICTVWYWTVLTVITHKLLLDVQLHNRRETAKLMSSAVECS